MPTSQIKRISAAASIVLALGILGYACAPSGKSSSTSNLLAGDAASRVYVAPGSYDTYYAFLSGGFSGQVTVYGLPSGRLFKQIPVFSQYPQTGYGYSEESKAMLSTTFGSVPWDDSHHTEMSLTNGVPDGRWLFINANNTPRIARIDLKRFETDEIIQIPNAAGGHASPFATPDTKYVVSATRFSVPIPQADVPIESYKKNFKGTLTFVRANEPGKMDIAFQIMMPGYDYDLGHAGKGPSDGWFFFTTYNSEEANTKLEVNASQADKDYIAAVNYRRAEECIAAGKAKKFGGTYVHNFVDPSTKVATSETKNGVTMLVSGRLRGLVYYLPTPKSPHGVDIDPSGEYIVAGGKLATVIPVHSFTQDDEGDRRQAVREDDRRHSGAPVRCGDRRRGAEARTGPAAHGVRRQGQRLHVDVHLVGSGEVEAGNVAGARPDSGLLLGRPHHDSGWRRHEAVRASICSRSTRSRRTAICRRDRKARARRS